MNLIDLKTQGLVKFSNFFSFYWLDAVVVVVATQNVVFFMTSPFLKEDASEIFKPASKPGYPNLRRVDFFKK